MHMDLKNPHPEAFPGSVGMLGEFCKDIAMGQNLKRTFLGMTKTFSVCLGSLRVFVRGFHLLSCHSHSCLARK